MPASVPTPAPESIDGTRLCTVCQGSYAPSFQACPVCRLITLQFHQNRAAGRVVAAGIVKTVCAESRFIAKGISRERI